MMARYSQYSGGSGTNPSVSAKGETVSQAPSATMIREVMMSGQLARLWMNGILLVRIIWMIRVWVNSDSTNQPVWNKAGSFQLLNRYNIMKNVRQSKIELIGPINKIKRRILSMVHWRGLISHSASTSSVGMVVCEKSYRRLLISTWIGSMGRNGRNALAPTTLNMLPKFELAAILMYLTMLPNTRRPSNTPCSRTSRLFSRRMMSEDSLAMSTALSTEMPTSAAFRAEASLMPSPMNPSTWLWLWSARMIRSLWAGASLAKTLVVPAAAASSPSLIVSICEPSRSCSTGMPTSLQM